MLSQTRSRERNVTECRGPGSGTRNVDRVRRARCLLERCEMERNATVLLHDLPPSGV